MDIKEIQNLIRFVSKSEVSEVKYKTKDFEILIKTNSGVVYTPAPQIQTIATQPANVQPAAAQTPTNAAPASSEDTSKYVAIKSPMIGTFYSRPTPDKPSFVNVGDSVTAGKVVCIVEAMKLFNEIESEVSGKIVKILVTDASPVDFDQPLFLVDPS
ncbi:MAG: acetyl-CoA carboxylase biotin carboxyl carrier protein [Flavobacteriaceae bacterium]|nr:acetyl-CoA carboxylase biotin carboxyl carrier protein [Flavobacteriaceae bacterium]